MLNKKNNNQYFIIFIIVGLFFAFNLVAVASQQLTADEITDKVKENQADYQNSKTQTEMVLIDQEGKEEEEIREIIMFEKDEGEDKVTMLMRFLSPKSVEGVTLLSIENGDKIYLYLPAYQKPRRIAGSSKQENFMGTDFSYEDLSMDYQNDDYQRELLKETEKQYILKAITSDEELSYSQFILYVNKEKFYVEKVEFFALDGQHTKTLEIKEVNFDDEGKITPMKMEMNDIIDKHQTQMNIKEIDYNLDLSDSFFTIRTLQRPRL